MRRPEEQESSTPPLSSPSSHPRDRHVYTLPPPRKGRDLKLHTSQLAPSMMCKRTSDPCEDRSAKRAPSHISREVTPPEWVRHSPVDTTSMASESAVRSSQPSCRLQKRHGVSFETACNTRPVDFSRFHSSLWFRGGAES